ncbi:hypothetical protein ABW19_dt0203667 [Dactylella cylindrospora]|nr:hypothetical protein ABW19_dt0203667 [Dactylella cylindrospora]
MEVVGGVANILAITTAVLQSAKALYQAIEAIKDAPSNIQRVQNSLSRILNVLQLIRNVVQSYQAQPARSSRVEDALFKLETPIKECTAYIIETNNTLEKYTYQPSTGTLKKWKKLGKAALDEKKIEALWTKLNDQVQELEVAVASVNLQVDSRGLCIEVIRID